jgi:SAM-dependent methyltransferase
MRNLTGPHPDRPAGAGDDYARIARWYDRAARPLRPFRRRIAALCAENGWRAILDYGCGAGEQIALLRQSGAAVTGLDLSPSMLAVARGRFPDKPGLVRGTFPAPFADGSFDAVLLSLVLHETAAGAGNMLRDALRLAPRALVLEWRMPERNLDYPGQIVAHCIERLAGREHYRRFRRFAAAGWLRGTARREGIGLRWETREAGGLLTLALAEKMSAGAGPPSPTTATIAIG